MSKYNVIYISTYIRYGSLAKLMHTRLYKVNREQKNTLYAEISPLTNSHFCRLRTNKKYVS